MDDQTQGSSGVKLRPFKKGLTYQEYANGLKMYAEARGLEHVIDVANKPGPPPARLPVATTAEVFMAKVKPVEAYMEALGYATNAMRRAFDEDAFDEDVAEQWSELVQENRDDIKEHKLKLKLWPQQVTKLKAAVKASCLEYPDAKRVLDANDDTHEDALWNLLGDLKTAFGDAEADTKDDDLFNLLFFIFASGDTVEQHNSKLSAIVARLERPVDEGGFGRAGITVEYLA